MIKIYKFIIKICEIYFQIYILIYLKKHKKNVYVKNSFFIYKFNLILLNNFKLHSNY